MHCRPPTFLGVGMVLSAEPVCTLVPPLVFGEISVAMLVRFWESAMKAEATLNCTTKRIGSRTLVATWRKEWRNPWRTRATMVVETRRGCTIRLNIPDRRWCCVIHTCKWAGAGAKVNWQPRWRAPNSAYPSHLLIFVSLLSTESTVLRTFILHNKHLMRHLTVEWGRREKSQGTWQQAWLGHQWTQIGSSEHGCSTASPSRRPRSAGQI